MNSTSRPSELQSLRSQVADLARELAERDCSLETRSRLLEQTVQDLWNILETVPDFLFRLDTNGNLTYWNRQVEYITGYSTAELLNKPALDFVSCEEKERVATAIQRAFADGCAQYEGHLRTKDGRVVPYHWTGAVLKTSDGRIIGIAGVGRDVSEKRRAEAELAKQRRHLVEAQALAHLGSWEWDIGAGTMEWSDELFRIFGHTPQSLSVTHETFLAALLPEDHDRVLAAINDALMGRAPFDVECRIVRPTGDVRTLYARGEVGRDSSGRPVAMSGTVLDFTERNQMADALRASEERWQLAVRGSNDGIWDWNIQTGKVFFSERWKAMRGYENHEIADVLDEWRSRIHPDDLDRVLQRLDAYLAKLRPEYCEEYRVLRKDGSYMWILDRGVALWADDGTPLRMVGSESDITERKRAEEALRVSEERYARATAVGRVGVWELDVANGRCHGDANLKTLLGYGPEELSTDPAAWLELIHPEDRPIAFETWDRIASGATDECQCELRVVRKDGGIVWTEVRSHAERDEQGRVLRHVGTAVTITERKQAQESLLRKERELRTVLDALPVGVWLTDQQGRVLYGNPVAQQIWAGAARVGLPDLDHGAYHWERVEDTELPHRWTLASALAKGQAALNETLEIETTGGARKTVRISAVPVREEAGSALGALVLNEDITNRVRAEQALRRNHALLLAIMEAATDIIFIKDLQGRYVHMNRAGARMLGMSVEDVIGWNDYAVWPSDLAASCQAADRRVLDTGEAVTVEEAATLDGRTTVFLTTKAPYRDSEGRIIGIVGIARDITERKRAEEALRQRERDLRAVLEERERISQDLHDGILQSLYAIGLSLESCKPLINGRQRSQQAFGVIERAIGQLNHVMAEVRNFIAGLESRVLRGGDLASALRSVAQTMAASQPMTCRVSIDESATHRLSTEQALNLLYVVREALSNSLRHGRATKATVSLKSLTRSVRLSVADNGAGFAPARAVGVGHGLANMAARASRMGGRFAVRSRPGRGTRITIDLPKEETYGDREG